MQKGKHRQTIVNCKLKGAINPCLLERLDAKVG